MKFSDDIKYIKGIGESRATAFRSVGVSNVGELLRFYPRAYLDWTDISLISDAPFFENVCIKATVTAPVETLKKIEENIARDKRVDEQLRNMDWIPMHFWSKEALKDTDACVSDILGMIIESEHLTETMIDVEE